MKSTVINAPSLANCPLLDLKEQAALLAQGGAQWFHIDIMDGNYVPNLCFPLKVIGELKAAHPKVLADVHLMVKHPEKYVERLWEQGADYVSFHTDSTRFSRRLIAEIQAKGMKAGVVINPSQRVDSIEPLLNFVDYVVLMSVEPGFAGQTFMPSALPRVKELVALRGERDFLISVDGGIDYPNATRCAKMGANVFITGIYTVFRQGLPLDEACRKFQLTIDAAIKE